MAHELDFSTGGAAFVEAGDRITAWHKHGRFIRPEAFAGLTAAEKVERIMEAGRLNWTVDPYDVIDETGQRLKGWAAFKRSDNDHLMTIARQSYTVLQNRDLFELVEPMLEAGMVQFETAGALRSGEDVWALWRFNPKDEAVAAFFGEEGIVPFALLANNHSGRRMVSIMETPIRVVCANTLGFAMGAIPGRGRKAGRYPGAILLKHTRNVKSLSVDAVNDLWGRMTERYEAVATSYQQLKARYLAAEEFEASVLDVLAPLPEDPDSKQYDSTMDRALDRRNLVKKLYQGAGRGINGDPTAWNAYMAATEAVDWYEEEFPVRKGRLEALYPGGSLANRKQDVLNNLHALAVTA